MWLIQFLESNSKENENENEWETVQDLSVY